MTPFLYNIARAYIARYGNNISRICFVFPNKRSGTFFMRYLRAGFSKNSYFPAPGIATLSSLLEEVSGRAVENKINLLFILFNCYKKLLHLSDDDPRASFDKFRTWGEMVLSDFDDVDRYGIEAREIFKNVKDFREIESNYLSDEQREVMEEFFGAPIDKYPTAFWRTFYKAPFEDYDETGDPAMIPNDAKINIRGFFRHLWQLLDPLYDEFDRALSERGIAYQGMAYRIANEKIAALKEGEPLEGYRKFVFIGFYDVSELDTMIFDRLKELPSNFSVAGSEPEPMADFIWDFAGKAMHDPRNTELDFMHANIARYPKPDWLSLDFDDSISGLPDKINIISAPSNVIQIKETGKLIRSLSRRVGKEEIRDARVAVAMPDENMLLPLLYSIPTEESDPELHLNLTMGYPMRMSSVMSLLNLLRTVQNNMRIKKLMSEENGVEKMEKQPTFLYTDVLNLLGHPIVYAMVGEETVKKIAEHVNRQKRFRLSYKELQKFSAAVKVLFSPLKQYEGTPFAWIRDIMNSVGKHMDADSEAAKLDREHINTFLRALQRLENAMKENNVMMEPETVLFLAQRMIASEQVMLQGEPVRGLQVMGILETRCLDFDYLIVPSMNERLFPRRIRNRSFIPGNIRNAFGIPSVEYRERMFAYIFYRMISRVKEVWFLYDSRRPDGHHGDISRYLLQLQMLYAKPESLHKRDLQFSIRSNVTPDINLEKNDDVMAKIRLFADPESKKNFSASALQKYIDCPMKFYYTALMGLRDDPEVRENMTAVDIGNVIHEVMQNAYLPNPDMAGKWLTEKPVKVTGAVIAGLLENGSWRLRKLIVRAINKHFTKSPNIDAKLDKDLQLTADTICSQIERILEYDRELGDFEIFGCEVAGTYRYPLSLKRYRSVTNADGETQIIEEEEPIEVNMKYVIDRLDCVVLPDGSRKLRIVDYKSGSAHLKVCYLADLFDRNTKSAFDSKNLFQLMLYAESLVFDHPEVMQKADSPGIGLEIYSPVGFVTEGISKKPKKYVPKPGKNGELKYEPVPIDAHTDFSEEWKPLFDALLNEIFDPMESFYPTTNPKSCTYCNFALICRR